MDRPNFFSKVSDYDTEIVINSVSCLLLLMNVSYRLPIFLKIFAGIPITI
jgi:hypothetical protein